MSLTNFEKLTPEQEALIPVYREKWRQIAVSTQRLDRQKACKAIKAAYALIGEAEPEIIFYDSPKAALNTIIQSQLFNKFDGLLVARLRDSPRIHWFDKICCYIYKLQINPVRKNLINKITNNFSKPLHERFLGEIKVPLESQIIGRSFNEELPDRPGRVYDLDMSMIVRDRLWDRIEDGIIAQLKWHLEDKLEWEILNQLFEELGQKTVLEEKLKQKLDWHLGREYIEQQESYRTNDIKKQYLKPSGGGLHLRSWAVTGSWMDYAISVLNVIYNPEQWEVYQSLVSHCGWTFPYEGICLVCERPTKLSFDSDYRLHAEGEPAIEFADGYRLYYQHGVNQ